MFGQFGDFFNRLGGLLGLGGGGSQIPAEYYASGPVAPMAANEQGPAIPPPPGGVADRRDPFARFTPEQRQQLGLGYLADAAMQFGGRQGTAANALMNAFDTSAGRTPTRPAAAQQEPQMQFAPLQPLPPVTMPPMRPMALNIPRRTALQVPSLLGV